MKIGIVGSGMIGATAARILVRAGHEVTVANSRGPASLRALVEELGPRATAATVDGACEAELVLLAVPFKVYAALPAAKLRGKIVVDAMNHYPRRDGDVDFGGLSSSELVARHLKGARLVKAFNTIFFETLAHQGRPDAPEAERLAIFVASDDADAREQVCALVRELGFAPVVTGSLAEGKRQEPGTPLFNRPMKAGEATRAVRR